MEEVHIFVTFMLITFLVHFFQRITEVLRVELKFFS
jgi:hypothetical protein